MLLNLFSKCAHPTLFEVGWIFYGRAILLLENCFLSFISSNDLNWHPNNDLEYHSFHYVIEIYLQYYFYLLIAIIIIIIITLLKRSHFQLQNLKMDFNPFLF